MINRFLNHLEEWLIAFLIGAATLVIFLAVLHRYLSGVPWIQDYTIQINMSWAQELCIFMFVWMAKFGAAYGVRTGIHVGVDVVLRKLQGRSYKALVLFGLLSGALFTGTVAALGGNFVWHIAQTDQTSADLEVPMWWVYACVPLGSSLMSYRFLQVAWAFLKTGELPHHDHAHVEGVEDDVLEEAFAADANNKPKSA
ncbi:MAG: TRAP transporter small permease [Burkholderiaceae bacterium]|uniref:TRAP transporter small permease n=1 Tax=Paucibacter sp. KCTC 42545 TaxID=1768242 RepID=UPI000733C1ED|nr:TRAP transporter small permease [Paucibacter sp. KCTC 42545]ALT78457.1 C4-dicarboxylate ABC transporter permease [Paucibacter sp. KCTC 42545]MBY0233396.1 TRAP transporter small permease [Burkholderiaceae bacterium]